MIKKLGKAVAAAALHTLIKNKAVKKAKEKAKDESSIDNQFYISMPANRDWKDLKSGVNNQNHKVMIIKLKSYIKNFGGTKIKVADSTEDTKIYFSMPRTSVKPMFRDIKKHHTGVSLGEVKLRKN